MPTIYDNYSDVIEMLGNEPVSYSYVSAYYTTYSYIESKNYAYALTAAQMDALFPLQNTTT